MQPHVLVGGTEIVVVIQKAIMYCFHCQHWMLLPYTHPSHLNCCSTYIYIYVDSTYTVEEAVEKLGFGSFQLLVTVFSGLLWVSREGPLQ